MKERPILFSGPMVRALLDSRKTQTRRIVKFDQNDGRFHHRGRNWHANDTDGYLRWCPYGVPGDRLWVREAHAIVGTVDPGWVLYRASGYEAECRRHGFTNPPKGEPRWTPSIHMPRWASRILLEVTGVRVERLQDISEVDCMAEGITESWPEIECNSNRPYRDGYRWLWESINGADSWQANPRVWVVEFRRVEASSSDARSRSAAA